MSNPYDFMYIIYVNKKTYFYGFKHELKEILKLNHTDDITINKILTHMKHIKLTKSVLATSVCISTRETPNTKKSPPLLWGSNKLLCPISNNWNMELDKFYRKYLDEYKYGNNISFFELHIKDV